MKKGILATLSIAMVLMLTACGSPSQRWAGMTSGYNATFNTVGDLYEAGLISDEELLKLERVRVPASAALDELYNALITGDDAAAESWIDRTERLLDLAAAALATYEKED